jgi:hypothetical protein
MQYISIYEENELHMHSVNALILSDCGLETIFYSVNIDYQSNLHASLPEWAVDMTWKSSHLFKNMRNKSVYKQFIFVAYRYMN